MSLATEIPNLKPNIGIFTNPKNELYIAECSPTPAELAAEPLADDDVLVHIKSTGICGSDIHFWKHGCIGPTMVVREEHILGHESAGEIVAVGKNVTALKKGDKVAVEPGIPCQSCRECFEGRYNGCKDVQFRR